MATPLVIVESPAKARTIAGFLGRDVVVESSIGHIRDLPGRASDMPPEYKGEPWARLAVDVYNGFKPVYVVDADKKSKVADLRRLMKDASELYLATDEDREGEAIAWHLLEVLNPPASLPVKRMVFHEITPAAIQAAMASPRELDRRLVDAQEARRILDRLYGYEVSEVVWKKVKQGLSAGRVQSVATRIVVERERARMAFVPAGYWSLDGVFSKQDVADEFGGALVVVDGNRVATGRDFDENGRLVQRAKGAPTVVLDRPTAERLSTELLGADAAVRSVETKPYRRRPAAPFITSTLQQEAGRKLRLSAAQTMSAAQRLYENGYITYMRTDSTTLSETAISAARAEIAQRYGSQYLPPAPRTYAKKVKNAQEAHEAIRPAGDAFRSPEQVERELGKGVEARVYDLVWKRTIASQMTDATGETVSVRIGAVTTATDAEFATSGTVITHPGFRLAYVEGSDDPEAEVADQERQLPALAVGDRIAVRSLSADGHETQPPARFTEASLVKRMEELGVGRPSTYASIIKTVQDRGYVWKKGSALVPSFLAFAVTNLLEQHFTDIVDYAFTARMEDDLDEISRGGKELEPWLSAFYWGTDGPITPEMGDGTGLKALVSDLGAIDAIEVSTIPIGVGDDGIAIVARAGRYGAYVEKIVDGEPVRANIPEDLPPDELTVEKAVELLSAPREGRSLGTDPATGLTVFAKAGRYGPYVQLGEHDDEGVGEKPKTASLFRDMRLDTITLEDALPLLSLPRTVGADPADGEPIVALNGRYGPYLSKGKETRSLDSEEQLFTVTLEEALRILAEPKRRKGQTAKPPLREMGEDPNTGKPMVVKDGRFGPYVTDGETNASLRAGDTVEELTVERAAELLQDRRDRGPAKKSAKKSAKKPAKKSAKKSAKKATAKKTTAKKAAAKKAAPTLATTVVKKGTSRGREAAG